MVVVTKQQMNIVRMPTTTYVIMVRLLLVVVVVVVVVVVKAKLSCVFVVMGMMVRFVGAENCVMVVTFHVRVENKIPGDKSKICATMGPSPQSVLKS